VREADEFAAGHIENALLLPHKEAAKKIANYCPIKAAALFYTVVPAAGRILC